MKMLTGLFCGMKYERPYKLVLRIYMRWYRLVLNNMITPTIVIVRKCG